MTALLIAAGCAAPGPKPPAAASARPQAAVTAPRPVLSAADVLAESDRLRAALASALPRRMRVGATRDPDVIARAREVIAADGIPIEAPQLIVVVDRNPAVQEVRIVVAQPDGAWQVLGGSKVSTGQAGRRGYYITPTGVFPHTDAILDYRALGTFNENGIRGLGLAGMRVWDFGWQTAVKGWRDDGETGEIRLLLHATDPDLLEQRLGRPASKGCVRVPAAMNRFLDQYGVLDVDYERAAREDARFEALLLPDRTPSPLAGRLLIVVDSANPEMKWQGLVHSRLAVWMSRTGAAGNRAEHDHARHDVRRHWLGDGHRRNIGPDFSRAGDRRLGAVLIPALGCAKAAGRPRPRRSARSGRT